MSIEHIAEGINLSIYKFDQIMNTTKCIEAEKKIMNSIKTGNEIIFDLIGVEYISSSFLRLCGKASYRVNSENFFIINTTPSVKKVFKIAGLDKRFNILE
jgi:anti-anti-sigma factor